jgi:hypothetical protein
MLLVFCYKAEFEPSLEQKESAFKAFFETEEVVGIWNQYFERKLEEGSVPLTISEARKLVSSVIYRIDWRELTPKHGPGAVYPPRKPEHKSRFLDMYRSIQEFYPYDQFFYGLPSFWEDIMVNESRGKVREVEHIVCSLTCVPKDSRGPRLICVHPAESIWIQQGQRELLERAISRHRLAGKAIRFDDQTVNQEQARLSSISRDLVTLDLREASDRIGMSLVSYLFGSASRYLECSRAVAVHANSSIKPLHKFAPMGNCLTFPVQSLVFWALVRSGIKCRYGIDCDDIYVFGDDILFPSKYYDGALYGLCLAGLLPNMSKTFRHGSFRESCGMDAYKGHSVTPHRIRVRGLNSVSDANSICTLAKAMRVDGYTVVPAYLYAQVRKWAGWLPLGNNLHTQGLYEYVPSFVSLLKYEPSLRYAKGLQRWETRVRLVKCGTCTAPVDDWYHLQDSLLSLARKAGALSERGTEYPSYYGEQLVNRWTPCA